MKIKETDTHILVELVSGSGNKYEVGYPKSSGYSIESIKQEITSGEENSDKISDNSGYNTLNWIPNGTSKTSKDARDIGIVGGYVEKADSYIYYEYQINFSCNKMGGYTFKDESDDTYYCFTARWGNHYINYNSKQPIIDGVK